MLEARKVPATAPSAIQRPHRRRISRSTAPLRWWAWTERSEVTMIVASEVARQTRISEGPP